MGCDSSVLFVRLIPQGLRALSMNFLRSRPGLRFFMNRKLTLYLLRVMDEMLHAIKTDGCVQG
jgi:hypothetical protein